MRPLLVMLGLCFAGATLGACGPTQGEGDAGVAPSNAFAVELGTGRETFQALAGGDTLYLESGFQGAQHVLVSVRLPELAQGRYLTEFLLARDDGLQLSEPSRTRVPYADEGEGGAEVTGYRVVVGNDTVEDAVDQSATLSVVVEDAEGGTASASHDVHVEWAPEGWDPDAG